MALSHSPKIITDGLVLALDAANPRSYPGTGTVWKDLSGNGNNGALVNGVTFSSQNSGTMIFDGVDDYVSESMALSDSFWQSSWTANFWINFNLLSVTGTGDNTLVQHGLATLNKGIHLCQRQSKLYFGLYGNDIPGTSILNIDQWYYVTFRLNNSTRVKSIHINGMLDASHTGSEVYTGIGNNTRIGGRVLNFGLTLNGKLPQCSFYSRVLTDLEIKQNFEATRDRYGV